MEPQHGEAYDCNRLYDFSDIQFFRVPRGPMMQSTVEAGFEILNSALIFLPLI